MWHMFMCQNWKINNWKLPYIKNILFNFADLFILCHLIAWYLVIEKKKVSTWGYISIYKTYISLNQFP